MRRLGLSVLLLTGIVLLVLGFSSSYLWYSLPLKEQGAFLVYSQCEEPYDVVIVASIFDRAASYRAYAKLLSRDKKVALVEFKQPFSVSASLSLYVELLKDLGNDSTIYIGQGFADEIVDSFPNSIVVSPSTITVSSTVVVGLADFDGVKMIARRLEEKGVPVIWTRATHTTMPYSDGICLALMRNDCDNFHGLFLKVILSMIGFVFLFWWLYGIVGVRLTNLSDVPNVRAWMLFLLPLVGFIIPFVRGFYYFPVLGVEEIFPLAAFAFILGLLSGGKYRFTDLGIGLIIAIIIYVIFMVPMYYWGIMPYITLNKLAIVPILALLISPYTVALERWKFHFSKIVFSSLWLPFVYLFLWFPFLLSSFFYMNLPFYHIFFYSYRYVWIHVFLGFVSLVWFRRQPDYAGLANAYLWAMYMTFLLVEISI